MQSNYPLTGFYTEKSSFLSRYVFNVGLKGFSNGNILQGNF